MSRIKLIHLVFSFLLLYLASTAIHEYCHLITLISMGGHGYIYFNKCIILDLPQNILARDLVYFSGGLGCSLFFLLLRIMEEDSENKVITTMISIKEGTYGILEGLSFSFNNNTLLVISIPLSLVLMSSYLVYKLFTSEIVLISLKKILLR